MSKNLSRNSKIELQRARTHSTKTFPIGGKNKKRQIIIPLNKKTTY
jgi:hypothetical protein